MTSLDVFTRYDAALAAGDMAAFAATLAPDVIWHQPGDNALSGDHVGPDAVLGLLGRFMQLSNGTFALATTSVTSNGALVVATVEFSAQRSGRTELAQSGTDVFRIENDLVAEVWLMSADQVAEDEFWGK